MSAYLVHPGEAGGSVNRLAEHLREMVGEVIVVDKLAETGPAKGEMNGRSIVFVLGANERSGAVDDIVDYAEKTPHATYCVYIADAIDARDYKRLLKTGQAEWVQTEQAPVELRDVVSRWLMRIDSEGQGEGPRSTVMSFLPSGGGVGNTTLVIETAVWLARHQGKAARACIVDLNFQDGNVCDLLNIEPQFDVMELNRNPQRLDDHMLQIFTNKHESGFDVIAAPKIFADYSTLNPDAVYAVFNALNQRYQHVVVDFPHAWLPWTDNILHNSDAVVLTGMYTVPSALRLSTVRRRLAEIGVPAGKVALAVNKFSGSVFTRRIRKSEFEESVGGGPVFYVVRDDNFVSESANLGEPMMTIRKRKRICRDIARLSAHIAAPANLSRQAAAAAR